MRICVIGGGIAGSLLAWRLAQHDVQVALVLGPRHHLDATAASGGVIRGYEPSAGRRELAIDSLLELAGDSRLRAWARYRQVSSVWAVRDLGTLCGAAAQLGRVLPGSVELVSSDELAARGWAGLPELGGAICERQAGYLDPDALRAAVLTDLAGRANVSVHTQPKPHRADATILAAGAWTPGLLEAMGRPAAGFRTKTVQYSVHRTGGWRPTAFADATTGLYGRPVAEGVLLGLPTDDWDVDPNRTRLDRSLVSRAAKIATVRFPHLELGPSIRQVSAADCYTELALLALRPAGERVYTFTGGSGGAAKSVLAASTRAATALLQTPSLIGRLP